VCEGGGRCAWENVDDLGFLLPLCDLELLDRERRSAQRRLKAARLPTPRAQDGFDFAAVPSVNPPLILELMRCVDLARRENVLLIGGSGAGKTDRATALAAEACARSQRVRFIRVTELATPWLESREERQLTRLRSPLRTLDLRVLDELGSVPASQVGVALRFDVLSRAYERSSVIVTPNLPFEDGKEVLGSERLPGATLDRLSHGCTIVETGRSRERQREARKGGREAATEPPRSDAADGTIEGSPESPGRHVFRPARATFSHRPSQTAS
jgi:DNA replication protein DnaC